MRSGVLLSLALSLFSAESLASPCIPPSASSSVMTVSSVASTSVTSSKLSLSSTVAETSTETETKTPKATESSATTETSSSTEYATSETASTTVSSADSTTLSSESTTAVSSTESATSVSATESTSTEPASSNSVAESVTSGSTTQSTTESAESSTTEAASTSSTSVDPCATPNPNPAFKAVVQGSGGNSVMRSNGQHGSAIVLGTTANGYEPMAFTVEPCTNLLRQTNGKYVCVSYGTDDYFPPQIISCQLPTTSSWFTPVYCEQPVAGQPLVCHAQRGECAPGCRPKAGTPWSQFYSKASPDPFTPATLVHFGNSIAEGRPQSYTPADFVAQLYSADPPAPTID